MLGINLNCPISYQNASFRYFHENEYHVTRLCDCDILLLVFEGILRFSENGKEVEVKEGEYYIQKKGGFQEGIIPSEAPKYLFVHFNGEWADNDLCLPYCGNFNYENLKPLMKKMHYVSHQKECYIKQKAVFYSLLWDLFDNQNENTVADKIAEYLIMHYNESISLSMLCSQFSYSKNYIIFLFKEKYRVTPFVYLLSIRLENAKNLLLNSSRTAEEIAFDCGFADYSHFYKAFKKHTALSPIDWKKQHRTNVLT